MKLNLFPQNNRLSDNGFSLQEEEALYERQLREIIANPRWYLDNLDNMREYRVSWVNYKYTKISTPRRFCEQKEDMLIKKLSPT